MAVQKRFTFFILLCPRLYVWRGHSGLLHVLWPLDETLKDIVSWILQVILCVEGLRGYVVPDHGLPALSLINQHHEVLLGLVIQ
jgi:hypothetical protein